MISIEKSNVVLAAAAIRWWQSNRNEGMTLEEHLKKPLHNCRNTIDDELALAVAHYITDTDKETTA